MRKHVLFALLLLVAAVSQAQNQPGNRADSFTLKIKYLYAADLSQAADDYVGELEVDSVYNIPTPSVTGYHPDKNEVKGTMPDHDVLDTVLYTANSYTVTLKSEPENGGTTQGGGTYDYNAEATVTATANEGFSFSKWTKDGEEVSTEAEYTFHVTEDCTLTANFAEVTPERYTITATASPAEGGTVSGAGEFDSGQRCRLVATAAQGYNFVKWTENGNQVSNESEYTFTVTGNRTLVAHFEAQGPATHTITISPLIAHGSISVSPEGEAEVGATVTITATPEENYELESLMVYNKDNVSQTVNVDNQSFVMPNFDVMVSAVFELAGTPPVINEDIEAPAAICDGDVLDVVAPSVTNADDQAWQMSEDDAFDVIVVYEGQSLDANYNGWKLRFMASNEYGIVYSNVVTISIKDMSDLVLSGELSSCTALSCTYTVAHAANATLTWQVTDEKAIVEESGNKLTVLWGSKGTQKVSVLAEDTETGCSVELSLEVNVQSYIDDNDVNSIVAKSYEGKAYLLIYPNPKDTYKYQWYKDGKAIAGANGQYYYPAEGLETGAYQVYISYNADANGNLFCGAFSNVYTVGDSKTGFAVYPNPAATGESLIVVNESTEGEVYVYTLDGKFVYSQSISNGQQTLGVVLPQGIYVLHFNDGENVTTERIVIQ
jgi:hypothetical protein